MVKEASDAGYELPAVFSVEDVFRIFGYRTAEELDRFLSDCPRHYIRNYFAEIYMGSADKAQDIRSNNDKYLHSKIVQAIQSAGIPVKHGKGGGQGKHSPTVKAAASHRAKSTRSMGSRGALAKPPGRHHKVEQDTAPLHAQPPLTSTQDPRQLSSLLFSKGLPTELCIQRPPPDLPQALAMQCTAQHQLICQKLATLAASGSAFQPPACGPLPDDTPCSQIATDFGSSEFVTDPACPLQNLCSSCEGDPALFSHGLEQLQAKNDVAGRQAQSAAAIAEQVTHRREETPTCSASRSTVGLMVQQWSPDCVTDGRRPLPAAAHKELSLNTVAAAQTSPSGDSGEQTVASAHGSMGCIPADGSPVSRSPYSTYPAARFSRGARKQATTSLISAAMKQAPTRRGMKRRRQKLSPSRKRWLSPCEDDALSAGSHEPETTSSFLALLNVAHMAQEQENVAWERCVRV